MDRKLDAYLNQVDQHLHPMSASERVDIVQEIRSELLELEAQGLAPEEITGRLGNPKELAAAYLQDTIVKNPRFNWSRLRAVAAFYSLAGLGGMIVLPASCMIAVTFMLCGALVPAAALLSLLAHLAGIETPWVVIQLGPYTPSPVAAFPIAVAAGLLLLLGGRACWQFTVRFVRMIGEKRKHLA